MAGSGHLGVRCPEILKRAKLHFRSSLCNADRKRSPRQSLGKKSDLNVIVCEFAKAGRGPSRAVATWIPNLPDSPLSQACDIYLGRSDSNGSHSFLAHPGP